MKKAIGKMVGVLVILFPHFCLAGETHIDALQYVGGTIPIIRKVEVSGPGYADLFAGITAADYAAGFKASDEGATTLGVTANTPWKVSVKATPFTPVEGYVKPAGDLHLKIRERRVVHEGEGHGGIFNEIFIDFRPLSDQGQVLWSNIHGGDNGCTAKIDFKVLLNAARDLPGTYTTTVVYTISAP